MRLIYSIARSLQGLERLVPVSLRVPLRFNTLRLTGGMEPEVAYLPHLVDPAKIAIDVGANRGTYTFALAKLAREVIAFEPIPACATSLSTWARGRPVRVENCGVGSTAGNLALHIPCKRGHQVSTRASFSRTSPSDQVINVPVLTLDSYGCSDVGLIKIDVEGFELDVLCGAQQLLARDRPILLIEVDPDEQFAENFTAVFSWLQERNYRPHYLDDGKLRECSVEARIQHPDKYNFIFLP